MSGIKKILVMVMAYSAFAASASPLKYAPSHDWAIHSKSAIDYHDQAYGLLGYGNTTVIVFGSHSLDVPLPIHVVAGMLVLFLGLAILVSTTRVMSALASKRKSTG